MPRRGVKLDSNLVKIRLEEISVPEWARRVLRDYLEPSVQERGIIVPIVLAKVPNGRRNKYILVDGHGRYLLAKKRGDEEILARIVPVRDETEALLLAIELEMTRKPWSIQYTFEIIQELLKRGLSKKEIAERLKISRTTLYRYLWLAEMPEELLDLFFSEALPLRAAEYIKKALDTIENAEIAEEKKSEIRNKLIRKILESPGDYEYWSKWAIECTSDLERWTKENEEMRKIVQRVQKVLEEAKKEEEKEPQWVTELRKHLESKGVKAIVDFYPVLEEVVVTKSIQEVGTVSLYAKTLLQLRDSVRQMVWFLEELLQALEELLSQQGA